MSKYREQSRRKKAATYEERRAQALSGTKVLYLTCPLCGLNRPLKTYKGSTQFQVKPDYAIIQVRYGGGRGIGFFLSEEESIKLEDLRDTHPKVFDNLKEQITILHEIFEKL